MCILTVGSKNICDGTGPALTMTRKAQLLKLNGNTKWANSSLSGSCLYARPTARTSEWTQWTSDQPRFFPALRISDPDYK